MKKQKRIFNQHFIIALTLVSCYTMQTKAQQNNKMNTALHSKQENITNIAAYAAIGDQEGLKTSLDSALQADLSINEAKEILVQTYAYAGFPRSLNALTTLKNVVDERQEKGLKTEMGKESNLVKYKTSKLEYGTALQAQLLGNKTKTSIADFAPIIDVFLKEHLFADIFSRNALDFQTREIVTIATLASLGNATPQLKSHINVGIYNGLSENQLLEMAALIRTNIGVEKGSIFMELVNNRFNANENTALKNSISQNPWTLVYRGAITKNEVDKVNIQPVNYQLNGINIAANVYTPPNFDNTKKYPALVIAHPNGGVKEQTAGLYAQLLAEQGYVTITADAAYQGASGGEPRHTDKPKFRTEDIYGMIDFISKYKGVDSNKLGAFGICGGGGYTLKASQVDKRIKAIATLSMFNSGRVRRNGFQDSQKVTIQERLHQASDARSKEVIHGKITYAGEANPNLSEEEITKITTDLYREGYVYYYQTHAHPNSTFLYTASSLMDLMAWDATDQMELINQPLLMITGSKADTKYMSDDAMKKATQTKSKELFVVDGASHIQTYWKEEYVAQIVEKLTEFYSTNL